MADGGHRTDGHGVPAAGRQQEEKGGPGKDQGLTTGTVLDLAATEEDRKGVVVGDGDGGGSGRRRGDVAIRRGVGWTNGRVKRDHSFKAKLKREEKHPQPHRSWVNDDRELAAAVRTVTGKMGSRRRYRRLGLAILVANGAQRGCGGW